MADHAVIAGPLPEDLHAALAGHARLGGVAARDLIPLRRKGLVHDHVWVRGLRINDMPVLLRIPRMSLWGLDPPESLAYEATCFGRAAPSGHVPQLLDILPPRDTLPFGALLVEAVEGRAPALPGDLAAITDALAAVHGLPLPPAEGRSPLAAHENPVAGTLDRIAAQVPFLRDLDLDVTVKSAVDEELYWAREFATETTERVHPLALVLTDTHPGNFLIRPDGRAIMVDLEKALYGSPAIDLAHATLRTSTMWDPDCATVLDRAEIERAYGRYLATIGNPLADALRPWLLPLRRLTWLRTMTFCARWRAEIADGAGPLGRSAARLDPAMRDHVAVQVSTYFSPEVVAVQRAEWLPPSPLIL